ncbi:MULTISPECIES: hypothetical protein [Sorangium]|uniref:hypothetical protein n=1 Tax=Sorangium TaxID=39643 RepID=UPI003D9C407E
MIASPSDAPLKQQWCHFESPIAPGDLRLFVVGFNHAAGPGGARSPGVAQTATLVRDLAHADPRQLSTTVIAISGSGRLEALDVCDPGRFRSPDGVARTGGCLARLLEEQNPGSVFSIAEDYRAEWDNGGFAVVTGSIWTKLSSRAIDIPLSGGDHLKAFFIALRDNNGHKVPIYVLHTDGGQPERPDAPLAPLTEVARVAMAHFAKLDDVLEWSAPLIVGDFNMNNDAVDPKSTLFLQDNFDWSNRPGLHGSAGTVETTCTPHGGQPLWFDFNDKLHAVAGRRSGPINFGCSPTRLAPIRLGYTAYPNHSPAYPTNGIRVPDLGHNIIAVDYWFVPDEVPDCRSPETCHGGECKNCRCTKPLSIGARCGSEDACSFPCQCQDGARCVRNVCRSGPACSPGTPWCDCTKSCLTSALCRRAEDERRCNSGED